MSDALHPLRINVGFIVSQAVGYSRDFLFNYPDITISPDLILKTFTGNAHISRTPQGLLVKVNFQTSLPVECARCLEPFTLPIKSEFTELYAFSSRNTSESGLILPQDGHIDLRPLIRDYTLLDLPINPICKPDCLGLCSVCGNNLNYEKCEHPDTDIDPRLAILRTFLDD